MKHIRIEQAVEIRINGVIGFIKRKVTKFGNGAKVDCPKEYLGKEVYLVIVDDEHEIKYRRR